MKTALTFVAIIVGAPLAIVGIFMILAGSILLLPLAWVIGSNKF